MLEDRAVAAAGGGAGQIGNESQKELCRAGCLQREWAVPT